MSSLEISLRVTGQTNQGGRKYMEDAFVVAYQQTEDKKDLEYAFFGIFDGHGGKEAAQYAKHNLLDNIVNFKHFWQDEDELVLKAIRDGFLTTHLAMWKEVDNWPKTQSGLPSTAGTTASVAFIRKGKIYTGHVGDSRIVLGFKEPGNEAWQAECLTTDHKPESPCERQRILESGGLVMNKSGVERVVWKRPRPGHQGPVLRSTDFDKIPFLAVARSLGDLWSYDYFQQEFVVSPEPDLGVMMLDLKKDVCLILASDGLWNIMSPQDAVHLVQDVENENRKLITKFGVSENIHLTLCNPSKVLVDCALERWNQLRTRADNTSVVSVMLDLTSSSRIEVLKEQLILRMNYPRSLQVWDVSRRPKSCCSLSKEENSKNSTEEISDTDENVENKMGTRRYCWAVKKWASKSASLQTTHSSTEKYNSLCGYLEVSSKTSSSGTDEHDCSGVAQSEIDRYTNSPLQSCSNFLPEYSSTSSPKGNKRAEFKGIENSPCPFPRWSKSASGRTSLSKLATWSKVVSHRRMSDPFPCRNFDPGHSSVDEVYSLSDDENCIGIIRRSEDCVTSTNKERISFDSDLFEENTKYLSSCEFQELRESASTENVLQTAIDHLCNIKQAVKRKYPATENSPAFLSSFQNFGSCESNSSKKLNLDSINIESLKAGGCSTLTSVGS